MRPSHLVLRTRQESQERHRSEERFGAEEEALVCSGGGGLDVSDVVILGPDDIGVK